MFTFCDVLHEAKHKQILENEQYGLEISFEECQKWKEHIKDTKMVKFEALRSKSQFEFFVESREFV